MARVIQRKGPPYALIIFVFLFLVASTIMILQLMRADEVEQRLAAVEDTLNALASPRERQNPQISGMIRKYNQGGAEALTVVGQMDHDIDELTKIILNVPAQPDEAVSLVEEQVYPQMETRRGLVEEIKLLRRQLEAKKQELQQQEGHLATVRSQLESLRKSNNELVNKLEAALSEKDRKITELTESFKKYQTLLDTKLEQAKQEWQQQRTELNNVIESKNAQIRNLQESVQEWQNKHYSLSLKIKKELGPSPGLENQPDGEIVRVVQEADICYINKGHKDRIKAGLPFSVYPAGPIPPDGKGKAKIVVKSVHERTSECRILERQKDDPVITGDVIGNVAFSSTRTYHFVVEGMFDLSGKGRASEAGAEEVKALIKRFGGKIMDEIGVETDFLVMGAEPTRPPQPDESAPAQVWDAYHKQQNVWKHYQDVLSQAQKMSIPVLNTSRFLSLVGYIPE